MRLHLHIYIYYLNNIHFCVIYTLTHCFITAYILLTPYIYDLHNTYDSFQRLLIYYIRIYFL